ncbi:MAG: hypothetical protein JST59_01330 [Actinobacteria bacterium]|nr:hypothetical protein [Actinomycetota bacterium]
MSLREQLHNASRIDNSKLRKRIDDLLEENKMLRKGNDAMNRSRDLSLEMDNYYEQENAAIKQQNTMLME